MDGAPRALETALAATLGKPVGVHLRTPAEMDAIVASNPFDQAPPNRVLVWFLDRAPAKSALADLKISGREEVRAVGREVFVHYPDGMGRSSSSCPLPTRPPGAT